jgi:threonylcarbamoyladenosine tRNA methylthiotransferase MtaB
VTAKLKTVTLGCKVNQYETQFVREGLFNIGYEDAGDAPADVCLINTCTVTNEGDAKSRQTIRKLHRKNPDARIVVMGCYATRCPDEVADLPGVAEVVTDKRELGDLLGRFGVVDIPTGISGLSGRSRAYVKVQDGCLLKCSYCIIPKVRPEMYSRPLDEVMDEIRHLRDRGYGEVVLTGIHLGHYGVDFNFKKPKSQWTRLSTLVKDICRLDGDLRVRLSSIEATEITRELLEVMGEFSDQVCPHFHVCLQSGSDRILTAMKRRWGAKRFVDRCQMAEEFLHKPAFTTDVIVGFPGETDADFQKTMVVCEQVGFSKIHMFPFSPRRDTPAAEMENQVPKSVKSKRGKELAELESRLKVEYFQTLVGERLQLLVEKGEVTENGDSVLKGTSCRYAPVEIGVRSPNVDRMVGQLVEVDIMRAEADRLIGEMVF